MLSDQGDRWAGLICNTSSGTYTADVIDPKTSNIIASYTKSSGQNCVFTVTKGGGKQYFDFTVYWIKIYPTTENASITVFKFYTANVMDAGGSKFLTAKLNTPSITTLSSAFSANIYIKHIEFFSVANACTSAASICNLCYSLAYIRLPQSMQLCTTFNNSFYYNSNLVKIDFSTNLPSVTDMANAFYGTGITELILPDEMLALQSLNSFASFSKVKTATLPLNLPQLTIFTNAFANSIYLESVRMPTYMPKTTTIASAFSGCTRLKGSIFFPEMPVCTNVAGAFSNTFELEEAGFSGTMNLASSFSPFASNKNLKKVTCPTQLNAITSGNNFLNGSGFVLLEELVMPESMNAVFSSSVALPNNMTTPNLQVITKTTNWTTTALTFYQGYLLKLKKFDQPSLKLTTFTFNIAGADSASNLYRGELDYVEFDESLLTSLTITFCSLQLDEIIRICNKLPVRTSPTYATLNNNKAGFVGASTNAWNIGVTKYSMWISNSDYVSLGLQVGMAVLQNTWNYHTCTVSNSIFSAPGLMPEGRNVAITAVSGITGLSVFSGVEYYIVNATQTTFQLSTSQGGSPVTITGSGSATLVLQAYITSLGPNTKELTVDVPYAGTANTGAQFGFGFDFIKYLAKGWAVNIVGS